MMTLWLPGRPHPCGHSHKTAAEAAAAAATSPEVAEPSMIPAYATHSLGIGCIVLNSRGELLVIQEKFAHPMLPDFWKLVRAHTQAHTDTRCAIPLLAARSAAAHSPLYRSV